MTNLDDWFGQAPFDERNERWVVVARVAILVAWLAFFVVTLV